MAKITSFHAKRSSDRLAPSKALQEAKEKLGPAYFDAKLVECPQNAVELAKLLQSWDDIDKRRFRSIEETKRSQRILLHTLQSRYTFSKSSPSLAANPSVRDIKLPPPGFRYHANGDPKLSLLESQGMEDAASRSRPSSCVGEYNDVMIKQTLIHSQLNLAPQNTVHLSDNVSEDNVDFDKEMKEIEKLIRELDSDLENINIQKEGTAREKAMSFLRAHSKGEDALIKSISEPLSFARPNDRFPFQPGASSFSTKKTGLSVKERPKTSSHKSCIACQYKLKHNAEDFKRLTDSMSKIQTKRWCIPPHGSIVQSPPSSPKLTPSFSRRSGTSCKTSKSFMPSKVQFDIQQTIKDKTESNSKSICKNWRPTSSVSRSNSIKQSNIVHRPVHSSQSTYARRHSTSSLLDAHSVLDAWKEIVTEENKECNEKIKQFLHRLETDTRLKKDPKIF